jgi:N-acetylmuramic acid 6-phosphate etherase
MNPLLNVLGLMSGTSLDGVDIAYVEIHQVQGRFVLHNRYFKTYAYTDTLRRKIRQNSLVSTAKIDEISHLNFLIAEFFVQCIELFLQEFKLCTHQVDLIGSHGHTFYHQVVGRSVLSTLQLGEPAFIAAQTGITTVADFRPFDIAAGGQGAPLVPFLDQVLFGDRGAIALQNIGGIANVSFIEQQQQLLAFDNGPGNMLLDAAMQILSEDQLQYDFNGTWASKGRIQSDVVGHCLQHPYFNQKIPKTTGRALFGAHYVRDLFNQFQDLSLTKEDWMATLTAFVAQSIVQSYHQHLNSFPTEIVVSGGGALNPQLMAQIAQHLPQDVPLKTMDDYGISSEAKEAVAFALLAYCTVFSIPNNIPSATGASKSLVMGKICPAANFSRVLLKQHKTQSEGVFVTESQHLLSQNLDLLTPEEIVELMNTSDYDVLEAVSLAKHSIATVMKCIISSLAEGGHLYYVGAGTSGRLGVLDASECPPTFKSDPSTVQGIIAGGFEALTTAVENAEDSASKGAKSVQDKITSKDILIGISASGTAPFVHGALNAAHLANATTVLISCNKVQRTKYIVHNISLEVGPEVLSGSTRLKAGTATKMVLNILTTGSFAKLGKVYGNYMVDLNVSNNKLEKRAVQILLSLTPLNKKDAQILLKDAEGSVKLALLMHEAKINLKAAKQRLQDYKGFLRAALKH